MTDFIERLRAKPEHVRKGIALGTASGVTALIALVWSVSFFSSGALALSPSSVGTEGLASSFSKTGGSSLLSAVGALSGKQEGQITVVETRASSTVAAPSSDDRTVIPF
jgi:hypothetical protein